MYGTNDSYVDRGATASRITRDEYRANLRAIVAGLLVRGIEPILMTEPRWADDAPPDGLGENPNVRLSPYMDACREVAAECRVPLVDHFTRWSEARSKGQALADWTTDGCHPNPRGHRELAAALLPALRDTVNVPRPQASRPMPSTVLTRDDGQFHPEQPEADAHPERGRRRCRGRSCWAPAETSNAALRCDIKPERSVVGPGAGRGRGARAPGGGGRPRGDRLLARGCDRRGGPRAAPGVARVTGPPGASAGPGRGGRSWVARDPAGYCATACRRAGRAVNPARPPLRRSPGPYLCGWPE